MSRWIDADKLNIDFYDEYETADDEYVYRMSQRMSHRRKGADDD